MMMLTWGELLLKLLCGPAVEAVWQVWRMQLHHRAGLVRVAAWQVRY
jgi:hypothetical protein